MIISATTITIKKISQDKQHARVLHDEEHRLRPHRRGSESFAEVIDGNHHKKAHITITIKNHHFQNSDEKNMLSKSFITHELEIRIETQGHHLYESQVAEV